MPLDMREFLLKALALARRDLVGHARILHGRENKRLPWSGRSTTRAGQ
jgi:hypothetical protein